MVMCSFLSVGDGCTHVFCCKLYHHRFGFIASTDGGSFMEVLPKTLTCTLSLYLIEVVCVVPQNYVSSYFT